MSHCVLKDWVLVLPYRQQSVLISSLRGCDTARKDDPSKAVTRALRSLIVRNADPSNTFIGDGIPKKEPVERFLWDLDSYPMHFVAHTMHAAEIVGYKFKDCDGCNLTEMEIAAHRKWWLTFYQNLVKALHLNPETEAQLDVRLGLTAVDEEDLQKEAAQNRKWDAGTGTSHGGRGRKWSGGS